MKKTLICSATFILLAVLISCKKNKQNSPDPLTRPNKIPVVNAGADASVAIACNLVALNGSASDSDGIISAYLWTQISGPNQSIITSPTSASTTLTNITLGTYQFVLLATDNNGASVRDTTAITVVSDIREIIFTNLPWTYDGDVSSDLPRLNVPPRPDLFCDTTRHREIAIRPANSNDWIPVTQSTLDFYFYNISSNSNLTVYGSSGWLIGNQASVRIRFL